MSASNQFDTKIDNLSRPASESSQHELVQDTNRVNEATNDDNNNNNGDVTTTSITTQGRQKEVNMVIAANNEQTNHTEGKDTSGNAIVSRSFGNQQQDAQEPKVLMQAKPTQSDTETSQVRRYPRQVFYIIANEFCERFSYYGLRAILVLYFTNVLQFTDSTATIVFHLFVALCYLTPVFGAIMTDSYWGKYKKIVYLSIVYFIGELVLVGASIWPSMSIDSGSISLGPVIGTSMIGLALIGIGTGGIKPCVSALGGDQFDVYTEAARMARFFSVFYLSINAGSLISVFITPILRNDVNCFARNDCYPLAFGVPCVLMLVATVIFVTARRQYKINPLPERNALTTFVRLLWCALKGQKKFHQQGSATKYKHWLYKAQDHGFDVATIEESRSLLSVLLLFVPVPMYWCLFDQQASRWTLQATKMYSHFNVKPDQMQLSNSLLLLLLIPAFEWWLYPALRRFNILTKPLQRMTCGGLMAALAFFVTALIQAQMDARMPASSPPVGQAHLVLANGLDSCTMIGVDLTNRSESVLPPILVLDSKQHEHYTDDQNSDLFRSIDDTTNKGSKTLAPLSALVVGNVHPEHQLMLKFDLQDPAFDGVTQGLHPGSNCPIDSAQYDYLLTSPASQKLLDSRNSLRSGDAKILFVYQANGHVQYAMLTDDLSLPSARHARVKLIIDTPTHFIASPPRTRTHSGHNLRRQTDQQIQPQFTIRSLNDKFNEHVEIPHYQDDRGSNAHQDLSNATSNVYTQSVSHTHFVDIDTQFGEDFALEFPFELTSTPVDIKQRERQQNQHNQTWHPVHLKAGARYLLLVTESSGQAKILVSSLELQSNSYMISMFWQIIPYGIISASEVMFSVTGLEFSYAHAPANMKSVILGAWCLTTAFGNLLTVVVESVSSFRSISNEFVFYGAIMVLDMVLFAFLAYSYKPYHRSDATTLEFNHANNLEVMSSGNKHKIISNCEHLATSDDDITSVPPRVPPRPQARPRSRPPTAEPSKLQ